MEIYIRVNGMDYLLTTLSAKQLRKGGMELYIHTLRVWGLDHRASGKRVKATHGSYEVNGGRAYFVIHTEGVQL